VNQARGVPGVEFRRRDAQTREGEAGHELLGWRYCLEHLLYSSHDPRGSPPTDSA